MNISVVMVSQPITFTFSFCFNDWQRYTDQNDYTLQCVYPLKCTGNKWSKIDYESCVICRWMIDKKKIQWKT